MIDYSNIKSQHNNFNQQKKNQQSGLSIAGCSARSNSSGSSLGADTGPSTSATTIGCGSLGSSENQCCNIAENYCINKNCINIPPIINHPEATAAFKQNECNGRSCGTLNRTSVANIDYNKMAAYNNGGMTLPPQSYINSYSYQHHHHYPQFSPPTVPPPCAPILNQNLLQDDNGMDSV